MDLISLLKAQLLFLASVSCIWRASLNSYCWSAGQPVLDDVIRYLSIPSEQVFCEPGHRSVVRCLHLPDASPSFRHWIRVSVQKHGVLLQGVSTALVERGWPPYPSRSWLTSPMLTNPCSILLLPIAIWIPPSLFVCRVSMFFPRGVGLLRKL